MTDPIKLAVLGGSGVATPDLVGALLQSAERPALHVALIGRSADKLETVGVVCRDMAAQADPPITVSTHTDPRAGLDGADYVLNQVRVGGYRGRAFDETFPREFGIPGEETFGPGGMSMALRTIPVVLDLCRTVEEVAPGALVLNLTNPSSMVQYAISRHTRLSVISLCDLPLMAHEAIAAALGLPPGELVVRYTGMNHFGWVTAVRHHGQDLLPEALDRIVAGGGLPVEGEIVRALGVIPTSYFKYYYHPDRMLAAQQGRRARAEELLDLEAEILETYRSGAPDEKAAGLAKRNAAWYAHVIVPALLAHAGDSGAVQALQVTNGAALPFMPPQAIVEVPCVVRRSGVLPLAYDGGLPPDLEALLLANATFEMLWVEAVVEQDRPKALRALLASHLIHTYDQAQGILDKIWPG